jgi:AraC-like DNA-binding protein
LKIPVMSVPPANRPPIVAVPAPADLAAWISAAVVRDEQVDGGVVRLLPEPRMSIQMRLGDPYWIREQDRDADWQQLPELTLWGPRHRWAWGHVARRAHVYGLALTPTGFAAVFGRPATALLDRVVDLGSVDAGLARALAPRGEDFPAWCRRAFEAFRARGEAAAAGGVSLDPVYPILAAAAGASVPQAAAACGLSERQFRRRFAADHGVAPKTWQRMLRVDRMIRQLHAEAWEADGYGDLPIPFADQPHAIREFRALTGMTPLGYVRAKRSGDATLRSVRVPDAPPPPCA